MAYTGTVINVKNLVAMSCFGRIKPDEGGRSIFVSAVNCDEFKLENGMHVSYDLQKGVRSNFAINVEATS